MQAKINHEELPSALSGTWSTYLSMENEVICTSSHGWPCEALVKVMLLSVHDIRSPWQKAYPIPVSWHGWTAAMSSLQACQSSDSITFMSLMNCAAWLVTNLPKFGQQISEYMRYSCTGCLLRIKFKILFLDLISSVGSILGIYVFTHWTIVNWSAHLCGEIFGSFAWTKQAMPSIDPPFETVFCSHTY